MSAKCSICTHERRAEIDEDIKRGGTSYEKLAEKYGASPSALFRHKSKGHVYEVEDLGDTVGRVQKLAKQIQQLLSDAEASGDLEARTAAVRAATPGLRLLSQISGSLRQLAPPVRESKDFSKSPEYCDLIAKVNEAVTCPSCRENLERVFV